VKCALTTRDPEETLSLGAAIGAAARPGLVVTLEGGLGAGKTVLAKGIAKGLGVPGWKYVTSPTFALHNVYQGRLLLHHIDLYRLGRAEEIDGLGLDDLLGGSDVCVIEWPDLFWRELPADRLSVRFSWGASDERALDVESSGPLSDEVLKRTARAPNGAETAER